MKVNYNIQNMIMILLGIYKVKNIHPKLIGSR